MRHVDNQTIKADEEADFFQMEFDSSDEEGRGLEALRLTNSKKRRNLACDDTTVIMKSEHQKKSKKFAKRIRKNTKIILIYLFLSFNKVTRVIWYYI